MIGNFDESALLNLFVGKVGEIRKWTLEPFALGEYVYATDCMIMIRINKKMLNKEYPSKNNPIISFPSIPSLSICYEINEISKLLKSITKERVIVTEKEEELCEECNGTGRVTYEYVDLKGKPYELEENCPICEGDGFIYKEKEIETDEFDYPKHCPVKVYGGFLNAYYVEVLQKAMSILGINTITLCEDLPDMSLFRLNESIHVAVAKLFIDSESYYELKEETKV